MFQEVAKNLGMASGRFVFLITQFNEVPYFRGTLMGHVKLQKVAENYMCKHYHLCAPFIYTKSVLA